MVDSVNALILAYWKFTIEDISEQLGISVGLAYKIIHDDITFSRVCCYWVSKMLTPDHRQRRVMWWDMSLPLQAWVEKTAHGEGTHWHSGKEKVAGAVVSKEAHANSFLGPKKTHYNWFFWKKVQL